MGKQVQFGGGGGKASFLIGMPEVGYVDTEAFKPISGLPNQILNEIDFADPSKSPAVKAEIKVPKDFPSQIDSQTGEQFLPAELTTLDDCGHEVPDDGRFPPLMQVIHVIKVSGAGDRYDLYRSVPIITSVESSPTTPAALNPRFIYHRLDGPARLQEAGNIFGLDDPEPPMIKVKVLSKPDPLPISHDPPSNPEEVINGRVNLCEGERADFKLDANPKRTNQQANTVQLEQNPAMGSGSQGDAFPAETRFFGFTPGPPASGNYTHGDLGLTLSVSSLTASATVPLRTGKSPLEIGMNVWILEDASGAPVISRDKFFSELNRARDIFDQACIHFPPDNQVTVRTASGTAADGAPLFAIMEFDNKNLPKLVKNADGSTRLDPSRLNIFFTTATSDSHNNSLQGFAITRGESMASLGIPDVVVAVLGEHDLSTPAHEIGHLLGDLQDIKRRSSAIDEENLMVSAARGSNLQQVAQSLIDGYTHPDFDKAAGSITENQVKLCREGLVKIKQR